MSDHLLVTGAAGALATHVVRALAAAGFRLSLVDRPGPRLDALADEVGGQPFIADLTDEADTARVVAAAEASAGPVDGLVHTVGGFVFGPAHATPLADLDRMLALNLRTTFLATRAVLPGLLARERGFVCAIASGQAWRREGPGTAVYTASKAAVAAYLNSVDREVAARGVRVCVCYPMGVIDTPANRAAMPDADPSEWIDPAAIGAAIAFAAAAPPAGRVRDLPVWPRA